MFQAYLQGNRIYDVKTGGFVPIEPFRISIHDPLSIADLRSSGVDVEVGYVSTFLITPSQIVTSPTAKNLPKEKRKCLFQEESNKLTLFKEYSQRNCIFECQLKFAFSKCQCIPWDYPHLENEFHKICDRFGRDCFEKFMENTTLIKTCDCPYECATTRYSYSVSSTAINAEALCKDKSYFGYWNSGKIGYPPKFIRRYEQVVNGKDISEDEICIENTKKMAIVKFQIANEIITRIKKTQRVTNADLLSNIGNFTLFYITKKTI